MVAYLMKPIFALWISASILNLRSVSAATRSQNCCHALILLTDEQQRSCKERTQFGYSKDPYRFARASFPSSHFRSAAASLFALPYLPACRNLDCALSSVANDLRLL